jgi:hypothetical protein
MYYTLWVLTVRILATAFAIICALMMTINGMFMLISPRAWFRLPAWMRASGVLTREKYSDGGLSLLIRLLGAMILILIGGVTFDLIVENIKR